MSDKPILFSGAMVRAILAGTKTQTRRVAKPFLTTGQEWPHSVHPALESGYIGWYGQEPSPKLAEFTKETYTHGIEARYAVGDILWVRENWRTVKTMDVKNATEMADACKEAGYPEPWAPLQYDADELRTNWDGSWEGEAGRLRIGRFMPRWASRISLEVLIVRVERVQSITEEDARAEGCRADEYPFRKPSYGDPDSGGNPSYRNSFEYLWDAINGKRPGCDWTANPWVWVYDFKKVKP